MHLNRSPFSNEVYAKRSPSGCVILCKFVIVLDTFLLDALFTRCILITKILIHLNYTDYQIRSNSRCKITCMSIILYLILISNKFHLRTNYEDILELISYKFNY